MKNEEWGKDEGRGETEKGRRGEEEDEEKAKDNSKKKEKGLKET